MRRICVREFGGPEVVVLEEGEELRRARQVSGARQGAGVNPYDTYMRAATYGRATPLQRTSEADYAAELRPEQGTHAHHDGGPGKVELHRLGHCVTRMCVPA